MHFTKYAVGFQTLFVGIGLTVISQIGRASGPWIDEAPPTLDVYFDRLPAKSLGQIFNETSPNPLAPESFNPGPTVEDIVSRIGKDPAEKLIAEVDEALAKAREGETLAYYFPGPKDINALHDLRDALATAPQDAAEYMKWRLAYLPQRPVPGSDDTGPTVEEKSKLAAEIEKQASEAKGPILAHWYYLRGALAFNCGDKAEARTWFDRVVTEFPADPRAEPALLMSGRCSLSISRVDPWEYDEQERARKLAAAPAEREKARVAFQAIMDRHPRGQFAGDAVGWLGAVAWDSKQYLAALGYYISQAELPDHPELLKSSILMTEKTLFRIAASPDGDAAFALIAKHPRVAMGMLYLVLGSPDAAGTIQNSDDEDENRPPDVSRQLRDWRRAIFPRLAAAVGTEQGIYSAEPWMPRYFALLAQAASDAGNQEGALQLANQVPQGAQNDDLLFAKAIAEDRAGKATEAIATFNRLLEQFPNSPLAPGARVRLAVALRDNHQAGLALVQLHRLVERARKPNSDASGEDDVFDKYNSIYPPADSQLQITDSAIYPDITDAELDQVNEQIDTLLNFAPLEELTAAVEFPGIDPALALDWRAVIAERALAHEDFATARRFMSPAEYGLLAANLESLTSKASHAKDREEKAELEMSLGDGWAAARGNLLRYPLDTMAGKEAVFHQEPNLAEVNRRRNAAALGYRNSDAEMEARDEMRHATRWWLEAAKTLPATPLSAAARLKVLEGIGRITIASDYSFGRASETAMPAVSRQIYDRLQAECPKAAEAQEAAYLSLSGSAPPIDPDSMDAGWDDAFRSRHAGYLWSDFDAFGDFQEEDFSEDDYGIKELRGASLNPADLKQQVARSYQAAKSSGAPPAVINCLEDLTSFFSEPAITPEMGRAYVNLRVEVLACSFGVPFGLQVEGVPPDKDPDADVRDRIARALKDPGMRSVRDYLEFLDAAVVANHTISIPTAEEDKGEPFSYDSRDYPAVEQMMRTFLKQYPHSKKREAARLLLARAVFRQSWPWIEWLGLLPTARGYNDYPQEYTMKYYQHEPFNPQRVLAELDAYDKEFPNGRYAADVRSMRASTLWRMGDWKPALEMTLDQLDHATPDLKRDAAFRLANMFAELANPEHRPALLAVIGNNQRAKDRLSQYLEKAAGNRAHPLSLLSQYLQDKLGLAKPAAGKKPNA
jgi:TolA-binding protein